MWARFDDRFHENRKIKRLWRRCPAALGLHVMAITYCAGHLTDGMVDEDFVEEKMPVKRARDKAVATLVEVGLWLPEVDGWQIKDFAEFNETRADIEARRAAKSEAGKKGAAKRWSKDSNMAPAIALATSSQAASLPTDAPEPDPTRTGPLTTPPPTPPKGGRQRDRDLFDQQMTAWAREHFPDLSVKTVTGLVAVAQSQRLVGDDLLAYVRRMAGIEAVAS